MAVYVLDSSAIVERYVSERGTLSVSSLLDPTAGHELYVARFAGAEVTAAIARRGRSGGLSAADAASAISQFRSEFVSAFQIVEITPGLIDLAMRLAETRALRGYDSVQLAAAVGVAAARPAGGPRLTFVSADSELNTAASAEGLLVANPNAEP